MRRFYVVLAVVGFTLALPAPAAAHHLVVTPPGQDEPVFASGEHWVGGGPLPDQAQGAALLSSPMGTLPPSHARGLVQACMATREHGNGVVSFEPPPRGPADENCRHGPP